MSETTARQLPDAAAACPHCGAARAPGVTWCTQCFAVLEAPAAPPGVPATAAPSGPGGAPAEIEFEMSAWDLAQRQAAQANPDGEVQLPDPGLELAGGDRGHPLYRQLAAFGGTAAGKLVIMVGGTLLLGGLFVGSLALLGLFV